MIGHQKKKKEHTRKVCGGGETASPAEGEGNDLEAKGRAGEGHVQLAEVADVTRTF